MTLSIPILQFVWDNHKGDDCNGKHLMIGHHLPKTENEEMTHINIYGISLDIIDDAKDFRLKKLTCHQKNVVGNVNTTTKEEARELLIKEIDKALDVMFNEDEIRVVNEKLNVRE